MNETKSVIPFFRLRIDWRTLGIGAMINASELTDWNVGIVIGPVALQFGIVTYYSVNFDNGE